MLAAAELAAHPATVLILGGIIAGILRGRFASAVMVIAPVMGLWLVSQMEVGATSTMVLFGQEIISVAVDRQAILFGYLFHIAALVAGLYSFHVRDPWQLSMGLLYAATAVGVAFAGDLLSLFLWWEGLAITSVFQIWGRKTKRAEKSGFRYLFFHVTSGLLLLAGIVFRYHAVGGPEAFAMVSLTEALEAGDLGATLILLAIGIKAAFPGLHVWLTDGYAEATPTGPVFLCAFTTKCAVCMLVRLFPGADVLLLAGGLMALFPIFYAVIENDLRRVLCYSKINQVGFMVVGVGIGTPLAIDGAVAHAFTHVIYKGLLFMSMGAVLFRTGEIRGSELGGLYKSMPWTTGFCIIGAASISAFPLFSGFVSKSLIMVEAAREGHLLLWLVLLFAAAGVVEHAGIKIPYFAFFAKDSGLRPKEAPINMLLAMGLSSFLCIFLGCNPQWLYQLLPNYGGGYHPYDAAHVINQTLLLCFSILAVACLKLKRIYPAETRSVNLDVDFFYRKAGRFFLAAMAAFWNPINEKAHAFFVGGLTAKLGAFTAHAPAVFLRWFVRPLRALGFFADKTEDETVAVLEERGDLGIHPVGLTALLGLTGFLVFLLLAR